MTQKYLWKVPCYSNRKTGDGENIGKELKNPRIPDRWGNPSTYWFLDAEVLATSKKKAIEKVSNSDYPVTPVNNPKVVKLNTVIS